MEGGVVYKGAQGDLSRDEAVLYTGCSNDFTIVCILSKTHRTIQTVQSKSMSRETLMFSVNLCL